MPYKTVKARLGPWPSDKKNFYIIPSLLDAPGRKMRRRRRQRRASSRRTARGARRPRSRPHQRAKTAPHERPPVLNHPGGKSLLGFRVGVVGGGDRIHPGKARKSGARLPRSRPRRHARRVPPAHPRVLNHPALGLESQNFGLFSTASAREDDGARTSSLFESPWAQEFVGC